MKARFLTFLALVLLAFAFFLIPAWIIQPFRYQSPNALQLALRIREHASTWTLILTAIAAVFAGMLWRTANIWQRGVVVLGLLAAFAATFLSRTNYFEWMFQPLMSAQFQPAARSGLDPGDMVMAVRINGQSRAYPIREMAYHHVLNDTFGGTAIAVTY